MCKSYESAFYIYIFLIQKETKLKKKEHYYNQGFKKQSRWRFGNIKIFAISVSTGVATLIAVVAV
jgi:hypothetical protein